MKLASSSDKTKPPHFVIVRLSNSISALLPLAGWLLQFILQFKCAMWRQQQQSNPATEEKQFPSVLFCSVHAKYNWQQNGIQSNDHIFITTTLHFLCLHSRLKLNLTPLLHKNWPIITFYRQLRGMEAKQSPPWTVFLLFAFAQTCHGQQLIDLKWLLAGGGGGERRSIINSVRIQVGEGLPGKWLGIMWEIYQNKILPGD